MPAEKKPEGQAVLKSRKAFSTACWELDIFPSSDPMPEINKWQLVKQFFGTFETRSCWVIEFTSPDPVV